MAKPLTPDDDAVLCQWISDHWTSDHRKQRHAAVRMSLLRSGLRCEEASRLTTTSLDVDGVLHVDTAKRGLGRSLQLTIDHADATRRTLPELAGTNATNYSNRTKGDLRRILGVDHYTAHSLRHTAAIDAYERTHDIYAVALLLGHRSPTSTVHYLRRIYDTPVSLAPKWYGVATTPTSPPARDQLTPRRATPRPRDIRAIAIAAVEAWIRTQHDRGGIAAATAAEIATQPINRDLRIRLHDDLDNALTDELRRRGTTTNAAIANALGVHEVTIATWNERRQTARGRRRRETFKRSDR